jgi:serine protease Do
MKTVKFAALAAALVAAAGIGAAFTPAAHGQATVTRSRVAPRAVQVIGGRGGQIGVSISDIGDEDTKTPRGVQAGVVIDDVEEDSPAAKAGVKKGDVFVEYDGERVRSARQFTRLVQETAPGRKVPAALMRDGQKVTVTLEPRENSAFRLLDDLRVGRVFENFGGDFRMMVPPVPPAPPAPPAAPVPPALPDFEGFVWRTGSMLGITTSELSDQLGEYFGTKDGVLVNSVTPDSAAAKAGVKAGDVITSFNGATVGSGSELRRRIQRLEGNEEFTLGVMRDKKSLTLKGKLEEPRNRRTYRSIV